MKITALANNIALKLKQKDADLIKTEGGLVIPKNSENDKPDPIVISVGPDVKLKIKKGDIVTYNSYKAVYEGSDVILVPEDGILAIIEK